MSSPPTSSVCTGIANSESVQYVIMYPLRAARRASEATLRAIMPAIDQLLSDIGKSAPWTMLGSSGTYVRPHVMRKIVFCKVAALPLSPAPYKACSLGELADMAADRNGHLRELLGSHWTIARLIAEFRVAPLLLSMWCCIIHAAMQSGTGAATFIDRPAAEVRALHHAVGRTPSVRLWADAAAAHLSQGSSAGTASSGAASTK